MIILSQDAFQFMRLAAQKRPSHEVSGFATAKVADDRGAIYVTRVVIPSQEVGMADTEISSSQLTKWLSELLREEEILLGGFPVWWHSHASMSTRPSATDRQTLADLADLQEDGAGWAVGIVINTKSELSAWMELRRPLSISIDNVGIEIEEAASEEIVRLVKQSMEKVKVRSAFTIPGTKTYQDWLKVFPGYAGKEVAALPADARELLADVMGGPDLLKGLERAEIGADGLGLSSCRVEYKRHLSHPIKGKDSPDKSCVFCLGEAYEDEEYEEHCGEHKYGDLPLSCLYCSVEQERIEEIISKRKLKAKK